MVDSGDRLVRRDAERRMQARDGRPPSRAGLRSVTPPIGGPRKAGWRTTLHQHSKEERDDDRLLTQFTDEQNDHALFIGWYDYAIAVNRMPIEAQIHQRWYIALHPDKLAAEFPPGALR